MFYEENLCFGFVESCDSFTGTFKIKIMLRNLLIILSLARVSFELSLPKSQANKNNCPILPLWFLNHYVTQVPMEPEETFSV